MRALAFALAASVLSAGAVSAATLNEGAADFSGDWTKPTIVASGNDQISGSWSGGNDYDLLGFTSLKAGAQTITLTFSPKTPIGKTDWSFSAGGELKYQTYAPKYGAWEGSTFGYVGINHDKPDAVTYTLKLGDDFAGVLYLGLYGTYGSLNYNISVPGNAIADAQPEPAPVPLPAGAALLPAGLAALALLRRRKTR